MVNSIQVAGRDYLSCLKVKVSEVDAKLNQISMHHLYA
jgi:hypothetical protein